MKDAVIAWNREIDKRMPGSALRTRVYTTLSTVQFELSTKSEQRLLYTLTHTHTHTQTTGSAFVSFFFCTSGRVVGVAVVVVVTRHIGLCVCARSLGRNADRAALITDRISELETR